MDFHMNNFLLSIQKVKMLNNNNKRYSKGTQIWGLQFYIVIALGNCWHLFSHMIYLYI